FGAGVSTPFRLNLLLGFPPRARLAATIGWNRVGFRSLTLAQRPSPNFELARSSGVDVLAPALELARLGAHGLIAQVAGEHAVAVDPGQTHLVVRLGRMML